MALFSRRSKDAAGPTGDDASAPAEPTASAPQDSPADSAAAAPEAAPPTPDVSISVSSFQGLGSAAAASVPLTPTAKARRAADPAKEVAPSAGDAPGLRDNVLLREALSALPDPVTPTDLFEVARQLLQGHLFLRVKGDARALLAEGKGLPLAVIKAGEQSYALAYSGGAALRASLQADGDTDTSAIAQPVLLVLRHVLEGPYDGLVLDHASGPARALFPRELLQKMFDGIDESLTVKTLLAAERTPETADAVAEALTRVPLWLAVGKSATGAPGLAEARSADGTRYLEVFSHPIEIAAMGRSDHALPVTGIQLAKALSADEGLTGVIVDPAGPWLRVNREQLAPVLALAE